MTKSLEVCVRRALSTKSLTFIPEAAGAVLVKAEPCFSVTHLLPVHGMCPRERGTQGSRDNTGLNKGRPIKDREERQKEGTQEYFERMPTGRLPHN